MSGLLSGDGGKIRKKKCWQLLHKIFSWGYCRKRFIVLFVVKLLQLFDIGRQIIKHKFRYLILLAVFLNVVLDKDR